MIGSDPENVAIVRNHFVEAQEPWESNVLMARAYAANAASVATEILNGDLPQDWPNMSVAYSLVVHAEELLLKGAILRFAPSEDVGKAGHGLDDLHGLWEKVSTGSGIGYELRHSSAGWDGDEYLPEASILARYVFDRKTKKQYPFWQAMFTKDYYLILSDLAEDAERIHAELKGWNA